MDSECINIDEEKDKNYQCNEPSASGTNMLFNADISGGSCFVFGNCEEELPKKPVGRQVLHEI